jgi:hypothetical protein
MDHDWDEAKRLRTLGLYSYASPREGENRVVSVGLLEARCIAVVWTERDAARRIISMRRARDAEERKYRALFS